MRQTQQKLTESEGEYTSAIEMPKKIPVELYDKDGTLLKCIEMTENYMNVRLVVNDDWRYFLRTSPFNELPMKMFEIIPFKLYERFK